MVRCLSSELFGVAAVSPSVQKMQHLATADQLVCAQEIWLTMRQLLTETESFSKNAGVVDDAEEELRMLICLLRDLKQTLCTQQVLKKQRLQSLYLPMCGALRKRVGPDQGSHQVSMLCCVVACPALVVDLTAFLRTETMSIQEATPRRQS